MEDLRQYVGSAEQEAQEQLEVKELIENTAVAVRTFAIDALFFLALCLFPVPVPFPGPYPSLSLFHGLSLQN